MRQMRTPHPIDGLGASRPQRRLSPGVFLVRRLQTPIIDRGRVRAAGRQSAL